MPGVTYNRSSVLNRLFISAAPISTWSAFLLSDQSTFNSSQISLTACWRERGAAFLFSHKAPATLNQAYVDALWQVILDKTPQFLWNAMVFLQEPDATPTIDNVWLIPVTQPSNLQFRVFEDTSLMIGNGFSELKFKRDSEVAIQFTADFSAIQFKKGTQPPVELFVQGDIIKPQQYADKIITLPLTGEHCGQFQFDLYLTPDDQLVRFDLGLKYFFEETVETNGDSAAITHREKAMRELHFPLFHKGPELSGVFFNVAIDPTALLDTQRTYFTFTGETKRLTSLGEKSVTVFDTPFTTLKGYAIRLQPKPNNARLVFSQRCDGATDAHYYLVPSGDFLMEIVPKGNQLGLVNGKAKWLTGYTGTETLLFPYEAGKVSLRFHPHQPAFASIFPAPASSHTNRLKLTDSLTAHCHTAWLSIVHQDGLPMEHISQPDGGPLYKPDVEDDLTPVFDYLDTTIPLPIPVDDPDFCLPLVPHRGQLAVARASNGAKNRRIATVQTGQTKIAAASTEAVSQEVAFENQILSATRKFRVDKLPKPAPDLTQIIQSTSPQGNLVKLQPQGNNWTELLIGEDDTTAKLRFDNPPLPLQKAFQTNQQFLVITNATNIGGLASDGAAAGAVFQNQLTIAGWPFMFRVGQNQRLGDYKNILIFKFCNESLLDRIKNPALWTQPKEFNGAKGVDPNDLELQLISRWVQDYINDAIDNQGDNPYFQDFIKIVQNPRWNGVLALKVDVKLDGLPTELQGLIGGIDVTRFNAHHVGMEINQVQNTGGGALSYKEKSSLFGLVYYQDINYRRLIQGNTNSDTARPSSFTPETFDFKVLTLMALFKNSTLQRFSSKIRVTMRELFKESGQGQPIISTSTAPMRKRMVETYTPSSLSSPSSLR
ncbi:MAG: hypothetical protein IPJ40_00105 [Saprospirales bacterium]|nr:hypothetical protein [Saprospirales bacterium]